MKTFFTIFLASLFGTGCYTQVKSSGDYWGYTGHREREKVVVVPNQDTSQVQPYPDSANYTEELRSRNDEGYSSGETIINNYYYDEPVWGHTAPSLNFSIGYGWGWPHHRPWWNLGYSSWYPYWY